MQKIRLMNNYNWLPNLEYFEDYPSWSAYEAVLYKIFKDDLVRQRLLYKGLRVSVKRYPIEYGREEAFWHITCKDYNGTGKRDPDLRRCERIRWVRAFIRNDKDLKVWDEPYHNKIRIHLLLAEERYIVILEKRENYYLLITAFYLDYDNALKKQLEHYERYKNE